MRIELDLGGQYPIDTGTTNLEPLRNFRGTNTLVAQGFDFGRFGRRGRGPAFVFTLGTDFSDALAWSLEQYSKSIRGPTNS
jgi:hypothetical protein